jgi:hypothetical protein
MHVNVCQFNERLKSKTEGNKQFGYTDVFIITDKVKGRRAGGKVPVS